MSQDEEERLWELYKRGVRKIDGGKTLAKKDLSSGGVRRLRLRSLGTEESEAFGQKDRAGKCTREDRGDEALERLSLQLAGVGKNFFLSRACDKKESQSLWDRKTERALRQGEIEIEAKLDLHGFTQSEAHAAFLSFVRKAADDRRKWILVVTGKGKSGSSVLRQALPRWCGVGEVGNLILEVRTAALRHGGEGAFYLRLKKAKR